MSDVLTEIRTVPVFSLRLVRENEVEYEAHQVRSPANVAKLLQVYIGDLDREKMVLLALDARNQIVGVHDVALGSVHEAYFNMRELAKFAILSNAKSVVLGHNHPSGVVTPGPEDCAVTVQIAQVLELFDIEVLDHVIVGPTGKHLSMKESGLGGL